MCACAAGKPVWNIEYQEDMSSTKFLTSACPASATDGVKSILSNLKLDATVRITCGNETTPNRSGQGNGR